MSLPTLILQIFIFLYVAGDPEHAVCGERVLRNASKIPIPRYPPRCGDGGNRMAKCGQEVDRDDVDGRKGREKRDGVG